ncbi:hypothetical protein K933_16612 [Candidatus Halobonum tyrrellensis G22]|uniref:DUF7282 domain-containing protein n=1 Tax=Candidatus Halobonum tyrrellensis G22 TaxID=1324957 RepID=V4IUN6_9EURY|nr:hypothetical protein K933_16612 [Candidatus Halobonum tyrrellensis G22]
MGVEFEPGDSVVTTGGGPAAVSSVTLDFGVDEKFDGTVGNASVEDVTLYIDRQRRNVSAVTVTPDRERVTIQLETPVNASAGDRMYVHVANGTSSSILESRTGQRFEVAVSATDPAGNVAGPTRVEYSVIEAHADLQTRVVAPFETPQTLHVSGVLPNRGYVVVRETAGSETGEVVGVSEYVTPNHTRRDVDVPLNRPVADGERLQLSLYRETSGNASYDDGVDEPYRNTGTAPTRTVSVTVPDADAYAAGGTVWAGQTLLYEGRPNTPYALHRVTDDGDVGDAVSTRTASADGVVVVNTSDLAVGDRYVLVNRLKSAVVDLDGDGDRRVSDDAMTVATQSVSASVEDGSLVLDSERGGYTAWVRADGIDDDALRAAFGDATVTAAGDHEGVAVRVPADGRLAVDTTAFDRGEYSLTVAVPDTGLETTATISVSAAAATETTAAATTDAAGDAATAEGTDDGGAAGGTATTAPLGPLVPLVALACAALLFARGRD